MKNNRIEAANRRLLISAFNRSCQHEPSVCAYEFTQFCIKNGIVDQRKPLPGQALKDWATGSPVPLWGAIGAYKVLTLAGYQPESLDEGEAFNQVKSYLDEKGAN